MLNFGVSPVQLCNQCDINAMPKATETPEMRANRETFMGVGRALGAGDLSAHINAQNQLRVDWLFRVLTQFVATGAFPEGVSAVQDAVNTMTPPELPGVIGNRFQSGDTVGGINELGFAMFTEPERFDKVRASILSALQARDSVALADLLLYQME